MRIYILTLFPEMFEGAFGSSIIGRAVEQGLVTIELIDIRDFTDDKHHRADRPPFGGGAGQLLLAEPIIKATRSAIAMELSGANVSASVRPRFIAMSPRGRILDPELTSELAAEQSLIILCGHYEGVDQRALDYFGYEEVSIGDYILTGGEIPAMALSDAVIRLQPGALGSEESHAEESVYSGLLEYPQYTRPATLAIAPTAEDAAVGAPGPAYNPEVPEVLVSGHHARIKSWQQEKSIELTKKHRPDLLK